MASMQAIERGYQKISGLTDKRLYKLFYSHIHPFPVMVLGLNPGGDPNGKLFEAEDPLYRHYEHDYLLFQNQAGYTLAGIMTTFLSNVLEAPDEKLLSRVPATNVIFRRSKAMGPEFSRLHGMSSESAFSEGIPTLQEIVKVVDPQLLFIVSPAAYDMFRTICTDVRESEWIKVPNGSNQSRFFGSIRAKLPWINQQERHIVVTGHPSKYARRTEWGDVESESRKLCRKLGIAPLRA